MAARLLRVSLSKASRPQRLSHAPACATAICARPSARVLLHSSARSVRITDGQEDVPHVLPPTDKPVPASAAAASTKEVSLDQLIKRAKAARNMHDMEWIVRRLLNDWKIVETTWPRWSAVIDTLGERQDPEILHLLLRCLLYGKVKLRRNYFLTDQLGERIYTSIIKAHFPSKERPQQANERIKHCVNQARIQRIRCDGMVQDTLNEYFPEGMGGGVRRMLSRAAEDPNISPRKAARVLGDLRKAKQLDEVFPYAEHLRGRMMADMFPQFKDQLFTALLSRDAYEPKDVERIGMLLSLPLEPKHWVAAVQNALRANDGAAALRVLRRMYDSNFVPDNALVIRAIDMYMDPVRPHSDEQVLHALDIMRLHSARGQLRDGAPLHLLFVLARQHTLPSRSDAMRDIIESYRLSHCLILSREPTLSQTLADVLLSTSHAEAVDAFARHGAAMHPDQVKQITRTVIELGFQDAQILPVDVFGRLLDLHVAFHGRRISEEISLYLDRVLAIQQHLIAINGHLPGLDSRLAGQLSPESLLDMARKVEMLATTSQISDKSPVLSRLLAIFENAGADEDAHRVASLLAVPKKPSHAVEA